MCPISLSLDFFFSCYCISQEFLTLDFTFRRSGDAIFSCTSRIPPSILAISVPSARRVGALHHVKDLFMDVFCGNIFLTGLQSQSVRSSGIVPRVLSRRKKKHFLKSLLRTVLLGFFMFLQGCHVVCMVLFSEVWQAGKGWCQQCVCFICKGDGRRLVVPS